MAKRGRKKKFRGIVPRLKLKTSTIQSIFFIFFLILSIISIFSFLQIGPVPTKLNLVLSQYFGFTSVFVPFLFLLIALLFAKINTPLKEPNIFLGFLIMFISVLSLFKQGIVGVFLWFQLLSLFTDVPTFLIFFFCFIVGFVVLFDTSVAQIFKTIIAVFRIIKKYTIGNVKKRQKDKQKFLAQQENLYSSKPSASVSAPASASASTPPPASNSSSRSASTPAHSASVSSPNQIWHYPSLSIFNDTPGAKADRGDVKKNAQIIENTLDSFGITAKVSEVNKSPSVTQYALEVALGTKLAKIVGLSNDLAMALAAPGGQIRVEAPIPGRSLVGIEVPNHSLEIVPIRPALEASVMKNSKSKITVPLGLDVSGKIRVADIAKMPHILIAGQTGSGKSVCINSWISSILFRSSPDEVKFIMVDPKRVELTPYNGIPHLLTPVITDPEKVISSLKWAVSEMENRYKMFTEVGAKNIEGYNNMAGFQSIPYIMIVIDELAEIMLFSPSEVEENICRLAQMARAVGIHLIVSTQRPSVNVITGLIKANIPARISFAVSSMTDSRVILDCPGAEKLLGRGDMLYIPPELAKPVRIQGCYISDKETATLIDYLRKQKTTEYDDKITSLPVSSPGSTSPNLFSVDGQERDALFADAVALIHSTGKASASMMQRHLKIGYARAARILDELEQSGIVGPANGAKPRDILKARSSADINQGN